jgi:hypothetical protein
MFEMTSISANDDQAVRDAFARWVAWQPGAPRDPESLIEHIEVSHDYVGLLETHVQGRRFVWRSAPAPERGGASPSSRLSMTELDPWSIESPSLRKRSEHVVICDSCAGEKTRPCGACGGIGRLVCGACHGQCKAYGYAVNGSRRLMKCKACGAKGEIDCGECNRGIAFCGTCGGEGRMRRWMEIESWQRSVAAVHPPTNANVGLDAEVVIDVEQPRRLMPDDLGGVPESWLDVLAAPLAAGERIARQGLRIARIPTHRIHYRLGSDEDQLALTGLRLIGPTSNVGSAFARRATRLRSLQWLLAAIAIVVVLFSLGRGAFFWSVWTLLSLLACAAALIAIYFHAANWTGVRRASKPWLIAAASCLCLAIAFAVAALPRFGHAQQLIAAGDLANAESELQALGDHATPASWANLRLAQIEHEPVVADARATLAQIPRELPQHAVAANTIDRLVLRDAERDARAERWSDAANALALLSQRTRGRPIADTIHAAAEAKTAAANKERDARQRLLLRIAAEQTYVAWERVTDRSGTPPLIALRTAMARDVATIERSERRRRRP